MAMSTTSINVRVSGALREHIEKTTRHGSYENVSEYIRDLIRRDKAATEDAALEAVKLRLQAAYAAPDTGYEATSADDIRRLAAAEQDG